MTTINVFKILAVLIVVVIFVIYIIPPKVTVNEISGLIESEISIGDHHKKVEEFLIRNGIESSGLIYHRNEEIIQGIIRNVKKTPFVTTDLYIRFKFDKEGYLISYVVKYIRTSF